MLKLVPLGGLGEIGLNALVVEADGERLLVDAGVLFPPPSAPGVELIVPDFAYLLAQPNALTGVLLTHGHEDHVGALSTLLRELPVPVYGGPYTLGVARRRLEEAGVSADLRPIAPRERIRFGKNLALETFHVCHSIPDALGFSLETPEGRLVHTGDFKLDDTPWDGKPTDLDRLRELGDEGVLCLLSDSTNAEVEGHTPSEGRVAETFARLFSESAGRVVVAMFASNIPRIAHLFSLSAAQGRRVVVLGRSMLRAVDLAVELGHLRVPPGLLASVEEAAALPRERVTVLTTGAQGEIRAGLRQFAAGELRDLALAPGDHVLLSARAIPGNERTVGDLINRLVQQGARVSHSAIEPGIHVSGHAARAQQRQVLDAVRPRHFVPIHGEPRHLHSHLALAREAGVAAEGLLLAGDGDVIQFQEGRGVLSGTAPAGRRWLARSGEITEEAVRQRRGIAEGGLVVATVVLDRETGALLTGPQLAGRGLALADETRLRGAVDPLRRLFLQVPPSEREDPMVAEAELEAAMRRVLRDVLSSRPSLLAQVVRL